jgi:hypothetical protein
MATRYIHKQTADPDESAIAAGLVSKSDKLSYNPNGTAREVVDTVGDFTIAGALTLDGAVTLTGGQLLPAPEVGIDDTIDVGTFPSGTVFVATKTSATQTYTLPTAAPGLTYTFVAGHADGEIIIKPSAASQTITGVGFAVTHPAGIENAAGTNVVGDTVTLVAVSATAWYATVTIGTWDTDAS